MAFLGARGASSLAAGVAGRVEATDDRERDHRPRGGLLIRLRAPRPLEKGAGGSA